MKRILCVEFASLQVLDGHTVRLARVRIQDRFVLLRPITPYPVDLAFAKQDYGRWLVALTELEMSIDGEIFIAVELLGQFPEKLQLRFDNATNVEEKVRAKHRIDTWDISFISNCGGHVPRPGSRWLCKPRSIIGTNSRRGHLLMSASLIAPLD